MTNLLALMTFLAPDADTAKATAGKSPTHCRKRNHMALAADSPPNHREPSLPAQPEDADQGTRAGSAARK
jgi:hypothetical protein